MVKATFKVEGLKELEQALTQVAKRSTAKAIMRRALKKAAQPMADMAQAAAPVGDSKTLGQSVTIGTKLSGRQQKLHRKMHKNDRAAVEMFVGAGPLASAHNQEFGNEHHGPQPFMRPAWDAEAKPTLDRLGDLMWSEIEANTKREARRAARLAKKQGSG